jgi:uridine kinase
MNIIQEYLKRYKKCIIAISGLAGTGKSIVARLLNDALQKNNLSFKLINVDQYTVPDRKIETKITDDITINDSENVEMFDWKRINKDISDNSSSGVIIYGGMIPNEKMNKGNKIDVHIYIKIAKQNLINRRKKYLEKKNVKYEEEKEKLIINKLIYPRYIKYTEKEGANINKFVNANNFLSENDELDVEKMTDELFTFLMDFINKKVQPKTQPNENKKYKKKINTPNDDDDDDVVHLTTVKFNRSQKY